MVFGLPRSAARRSRTSTTLKAESGSQNRCEPFGRTEVHHDQQSEQATVEQRIAGPTVFEPSAGQSYYSNGELRTIVVNIIITFSLTNCSRHRHRQWCPSDCSLTFSLADINLGHKLIQFSRGQDDEVGYV